MIIRPVGHPTHQTTIDPQAALWRARLAKGQHYLLRPAQKGSQRLIEPGA
jgi:hypothetical protein